MNKKMHLFPQLACRMRQAAGTFCSKIYQVIDLKGFIRISVARQWRANPCSAGVSEGTLRNIRRPVPAHMTASCLTGQKHFEAV
ncbi:hypothetical protein [Variovorax boronicumulans]|uniref:hypothetical protein n=1 Tax=Variovorax boronicumulans TaxID=436515 RepID=UPI001C57A22D